MYPAGKAPSELCDSQTTPARHEKYPYDDPFCPPLTSVDQLLSFFLSSPPCPFCARIAPGCDHSFGLRLIRNDDGSHLFSGVYSDYKRTDAATASAPSRRNFPVERGDVDENFISKIN